MFEESANALVKEMYRRRGWVHSNHEQYAWDTSEDSDSDDDDEDF